MKDKSIFFTAYERKNMSFLKFHPFLPTSETVSNKWNYLLKFIDKETCTFTGKLNFCKAGVPNLEYMYS